MKTILISLFLIYSLNAQLYLKVSFNEPMDKNTLSVLENYKINDKFLKEVKIAGIIIFENQTDYIILILNKLRPGKYFLKVENLKDIAGNLINKDKNSAWFNYIIKLDDIKHN